MARKQKEDEVVEAQESPEELAAGLPAVDPADERLAQGSIPHLTLTPELIAIIHAHRAGRAANSDLSTLWLALYEAAGPVPQPVPRTYGK